MELIVIKKPHSFVDVITNSSTELFVCKTNKTVSRITQILRAMTLVYTEAMKDQEDPYSHVEELVFESMFETIREATKEDVESYGSYYGSVSPIIKEGDIIIVGDGDNSIPSEMFDMIESAFNAERHHLG